jgi:hypothetical protein
MRELCHRCHSELPEPAAGSSRGDEDAILFCPRCAAPQILLPEHMRTEVSSAPTTGNAPPPRPAGFNARHATGPKSVDWRAALTAAAVVAAVSALLILGRLAVPAISILSLFWTLGGAVIALGLYSRYRPDARMDAGVGLRVGVASGLLMVAGMAIALAATGILLRFGTHRLAGFDAATDQIFAAFRKQWVQQMQDQNQPADIQQQLLTFMDSHEFRAGSVVFYMGFFGGIILLISACGGAFAGMLRASQSARPGLRRGE